MDVSAAGARVCWSSWDGGVRGAILRYFRAACWCAASLAIVVAAASMHPFVRSVHRAFWPSASYDTTLPALPDLADPALLVFSKTNGFRHFEAISTGAEAFRDIARSRGWSMFHTESSAVFDEETLPRFRVVVWHNASGAPLNQSQRQALRGWLEAGGGFVGIHAALDDSHASWDWYTRQVVGAVFLGHPLGHQSALVRVERTDHPSTRDLPASWVHFDEWYSFDRSVREDHGVEVLASLDESSYEPRFKLLFLDQDLSMGDHPAIWTRSIGKGRAILSALGHVAEAYRDPRYRSVLAGAIEWAGRLGTTVAAEPETDATRGDH